MLEEIFHESEIYDALKTLASSIFGAIATMLNTVSLVITLFFYGFSVIISYPFNLIQNVLNRINDRMQKMNDEYKRHLASIKENKRKARDIRNDERNTNFTRRENFDHGIDNENTDNKIYESNDLDLQGNNNEEYSDNQKNTLAEEETKNETNTKNSKLGDIKIF